MVASFYSKVYMEFIYYSGSDFLSFYILLKSCENTYFSGFNRSCVQETSHFNLFISYSVGIVVSIVRSTLPVLLTLPALFTNSKKYLGLEFYFRWLENSIIQIGNATSIPLMFNHLKRKDRKNTI